VAELEQVVEFQYAMLSGIEPSTAGTRLTEDVVRRYSAALEGRACRWRTAGRGRAISGRSG
jgi:hypothetical protein